MLRRIASLFCAAVLSAAALHCGKSKAPEIEIQVANDKLPPKGSPSDAPEFVRTLSLIYPQAEIYRVDNAKAGGTNPLPATIVQKTNHLLKSIVEYYDSVFKKHNFTETARLEQIGTALLQYERTNNSTKELISVDVAKLPYAENYLIRIGRSEVDYSRRDGKERTSCPPSAGTSCNAGKTE